VSLIFTLNLSTSTHNGYYVVLMTRCHAPTSRQRDSSTDIFRMKCATKWKRF